MAVAEQHDFSNRTLAFSERFQEKVGHSFIGRPLVRAVAGSRSPSYEQLNWYSTGVDTEVPQSVRVNGDPSAGKIPRFWELAFILGSARESLDDLRDRAGYRHVYDAVAYQTDGQWHVGAHPDNQRLFREDLNRDNIVAMRHGRAATIASMGIWLPSERAYVGTSDIRVITDGVPVKDLANRTPEPALT